MQPRGAIPTGILGTTQSVAVVTYKDSSRTNGGKFSENRKFAFDSQDKKEGLYNLETEKILTYAGTNGAHLAGEEVYILNIAGNWSSANNEVRCVFGSSDIVVPAFCNAISARSNLVNLNSAQVSAKGILRAVTSSLAPTEMSYRIAVTPDINTGKGFAEGTVKTVFAGSMMEARDWGTDPDWNRTSSERSWRDMSSVTGGIRKFPEGLRGSLLYFRGGRPGCSSV